MPKVLFTNSNVIFCVNFGSGVIFSSLSNFYSVGSIFVLIRQFLFEFSNFYSVGSFSILIPQSVYSVGSISILISREENLEESN